MSRRNWKDGLGGKRCGFGEVVWGKEMEMEVWSENEKMGEIFQTRGKFFYISFSVFFF